MFALYGSSRGVWTRPLPYVFVPMTTPRSRSCIVPHVISDADAVLPFTRHTTGIMVSMGRSPVLYSRFAFVSFPFVLTIDVPFGTNMLSMETASVSDPPPLLRRSSRRLCMPFRLRSMTACLTSFAEPSVNSTSEIYPMESVSMP